MGASRGSHRDTWRRKLIKGSPAPAQASLVSQQCRSERRSSSQELEACRPRIAPEEDYNWAVALGEGLRQSQRPEPDVSQCPGPPASPVEPVRRP